MKKSFNRREFLKVSGAAGAAFVAHSSLLGCASESVGDPNSKIVSYAIHPAIGIARVGNSTEYFIAPELPGEAPVAVGGFKDGAGAIKRQAVRFRVFGYNAEGLPVREITAAEAEIRWSVHVANRKAAWYEFATAMDIPGAVPAPLRNRDDFQGPNRQDLVIDPGARSISGINQEGVDFGDGLFIGEEVALGRLATDDYGRLIVTPAEGRAMSPTDEPISDFANNVEWCDDIADGPVRATLRFNNREIEAKPAWVAAAPPNYGPSILAGFVTLYDVAEGVMVDKGWLDATEVSFTAHILPLFLRIADMQWVNEGVLQRYGYGSSEDLEDPDFLMQLADPSEENRAFRTQWFERFRNPDYAEEQPDALPPMYGDDVMLPAENPRQWLAPTDLQYSRLEQWAQGNFNNDFNLEATAPASLEALPASEQPAALDRAALEPVLGGAFHPGTELTWIFRSPALYGDLFRINAIAPGVEAPEDFGEFLSPSQAVADDGPLAVSGPGDITKWMAVPWQTDTASCRSGYEKDVDPYLPTFWPARAPNDVMSREQYDTMMTTSEPASVREEAFSQRVEWLRYILRPDPIDSLYQMIQNWPLLGIISLEPGPDDDIAPDLVKVETAVGFDDELPTFEVEPSLRLTSPSRKR